jgi:stage III sporulation protein AA
MESILAAMNSGVNLITTIHGFGIEDLYKRSYSKRSWIMMFLIGL